MSLFSGTQQTSPSSTSSYTETPTWMQDAIFNQIATAQNVAAMPYQAYTGQRVASLSPMEQAANQQILATQGAWGDAMNAAQQGSLNIASGPGGLSKAQPYFDQAAGMSGVEAAQPFMNQQNQMLGTMNYNAPVSTLQPYVGESLSMSGVNAAQPYLQQAGQRATQSVQDYMNPFQQGVLDVIAKQGARNLSENLLPAVSDQFVRAGQFGGSRMGEFGSRALRDTQEAILGEQAKALQAGYGQAISATQADLSRQAQLAGLSGQLTQAQQQAILSGGQALSGAQQAALAQRLSGASQYGQMAGQAGSLTQGQQNILSNIGSQSGSLAQGDTRNQLAALAQVAQMAQQQQQMSQSDIAMMQGAGTTERGIDQANADFAYQQWQNEQNYPKSQTQWLGSQVAQMAPLAPRATYGTGSETTYGASPLTQLATGAATIAGLSNLK